MGASKREPGTIGMLVLGLLALGQVTLVTCGGKSKCAFPAIYSFGDSNADTGEMSAALGPIPPPNGITYFKHPAGRLTDGRVLIDFVANYLGLPYLSAYLDSVGTSFRSGANFASAGASILPGYASPFNLRVQINQFLQFKARSTALFNSSSNNANLPRPEDFPKALYTFDIGQNDLIYALQNMTEEQVISVIPSILDPLSRAIQLLYNQSARAFLVHNVGPIGCAPFGAVFYPPKNATYDHNRCVASQNEVALEYNRQLMETVVLLRQQLSQATITYVDVYTDKYLLINNAKNQGFQDPWNFCCGMMSPIPVFCGNTTEFNNTVYYGAACSDPPKHVSWDGIHYTDAANQIFAPTIINGTFSDPSLPLDQACPWT